MTGTIDPLAEPAQQQLAFPISMYDETGKIILNAILSPSTYEGYKEANILFVEGIYDSTLNYVVEGEVVSRVSNPTTILGLELSSLPSGSVIYIDSSSYPSDESTMTLSFSHAGTYKVVVKCFPFTDKTFEVTV
ncbi:hypothetical protein ACO0K2_11730 [Undibacterium sp. MH2W]|uniref:hypothetical protein n=1 Tax=Undibacterium sp. MH2W TaxID=3413044 RepID=UPI003BF43327